jgi:hypothetical protein
MQLGPGGTRGLLFFISPPANAGLFMPDAHAGVENQHN